ncbi:MAG: DUF5723 family protein [Rikenellaceae bacterium]
MRLKIKFITALSSIIMLATPAFSQYSSSSYFMTDNWQSSMLNPAITPEHGYILIPTLGHFGVNIGSSNLTLENLFYPNPNGAGIVPFYDIDIDKSSLINSLDTNNHICGDISMAILGAGFYTNNIFWNIGVNTKATCDSSIPKGAFELAALSREDSSYSLKDLSISSTSYIETYVGASLQINKKLSVGARIKFLMGFYNIDVNYDHFDILLKNSEWKISSSGMFNATAMGLSLKEDIDGFDFDGLEFEPKIQVVGYGAGVDFGVNYNLLEELSLSLAVTDLGFISWEGDQTISAEASSNYTFSGYNTSDENSLSDFDIDELLRFKSVEAEDRKTSLNTQINAAVEYRFLDDKMAAGLLYSSIFRCNYTKNEITSLVSFRPLEYLTANVSYAFIGKQIGAALNIHTNWINFFVGADYIPTSLTPQYLPIKAANFSFYSGIGIPLTKRK